MSHISTQRTNQKLKYSQLTLQELRAYPAKHSNDDWENALQEAFFYHLAGSCDSILHEINESYRLDLKLNQVNAAKIEKALPDAVQSSAFNTYISLRRDVTSWMSLLFELRNHGTHRRRVRKVVHGSTHLNLDNAIIDPRSGEPQNVYENLGCIDLMEKMLTDAEEFILFCRSKDKKLGT